MLKSISDAVQNLMSLEEPGIYGMPSSIENLRTLVYASTRLFPSTTVPQVYDHRPGRFVRHIDFNHFRTIGMRRSVEEAVSSRFVTAQRLEAILKVSHKPGSNDHVISTLWLHSDVIRIITV